MVAGERYNRGKGRAYAWCVKHADYASDECLLWPFAKTPSGSGAFGYLGRLYRAGPFMCERRHGPKPTPKHVAGLTCGNRVNCCINPRHLKWMTAAEYQALGKARGIYREGTRKRTFLTLDQVNEIRAIGQTKTAIETASHFGIKWRHVYAIRSNKFWIDGKPGQRGFAAGDPRNPSLRANRELRQSGPIIIPTPQHALSFIEQLVDLGHPGRGDILNAMIVALLEGSVSREELVATRGAAFKRAFYRENYEQAGQARSFDNLAFALAANGDQYGAEAAP